MNKESISIGALVETLKGMDPVIRKSILRDSGIEIKDPDDELPDIEKAKIYLDCLISAHEQLLLEIQEEYGCNNVNDFLYSEHRGTWIVSFKNDLKDEEFETFEEMMKWLETEGADE
jgi:hypothetical protein